MIYRVTSPKQLALYASDIRKGVETIIHDVILEKTADEVMAEIAEHLTDDSKGIWIVLDKGQLLTWACAKVYWDENRKTCAITWAAADRKSQGWSIKVLHHIENWARQWGCGAIYATRKTRVPAFARLMKRYGWSFQAVVFGRDLMKTNEVAETAPSRVEPRSSGLEEGAERQHVRAGPSGVRGRDETPRDQPGASLTGPAGESTGHGDLGPDAAGREQRPDGTRRNVPRVRHRRRSKSAAGTDAVGTPEPGTARTA